ncbi:MAG: hypothetical protein A2Y25_06860 [Candidatus Melainabacteria bacterium GWF2_37_15]|nr:MAG: hypothetical protein A2Y25_06860 [Candidatus Melainabacteria bacterium GWF2_37_15]
MKIILSYILIIVSIFISNCALAEQADLTFPISAESISAPLSLPVWSSSTVTAANAIIVEAGSSIARFILPFASPVAGTFKNVIIGNNSQDASEGFLFEEILYEIELQNSEETPIYSDTVILIKIPEWLEYSENTFELNDLKLSDKNDNDALTYVRKKSLLKVDPGSHNNAEKIKISFNAKILDKEKLENNPFCLVKFESNIHNVSTKWRSLP